MNTPGFKSALDCTPLPDGKNWRLNRDLRFVDPRGDEHLVHAGFVTDFASIPSLSRIGALLILLGAGLIWASPFAWGMANAMRAINWMHLAGAVICFLGIGIVWVSDDLNGDDQLDAPATLHDDGYRRPRHGAASWSLKFYWDWLLFCAMRLNREPLWKCWLIWFNVAVFGWVAWYQDGRRHTAHHQSPRANSQSPKVND